MPRQCTHIDPETQERCTNLIYGIAKRKGLCNYHAAQAAPTQKTAIIKPTGGIIRSTKKKKKPIKRVSTNQLLKIRISNLYYKAKLKQVLEEQGHLECFNCKKFLARNLLTAKTFWVAHLWPSRYSEWYWVLENSIILCRLCHQQLDHGIGGLPQNLIRYNEIRALRESIRPHLYQYRLKPENAYFYNEFERLKTE